MNTKTLFTLCVLSAGFSLTSFAVDERVTIKQQSANNTESYLIDETNLSTYNSVYDNTSLIYTDSKALTVYNSRGYKEKNPITVDYKASDSSASENLVLNIISTADTCIDTNTKYEGALVLASSGNGGAAYLNVYETLNLYGYDGTYTDSNGETQTSKNIALMIEDKGFLSIKDGGIVNLYGNYESLIYTVNSGLSADWGKLDIEEGGTFAVNGDATFITPVAVAGTASVTGNAVFGDLITAQTGNPTPKLSLVEIADSGKFTVNGNATFKRINFTESNGTLEIGGNAIFEKAKSDISSTDFANILSVKTTVGGFASFTHKNTINNVLSINGTSDTEKTVFDAATINGTGSIIIADDAQFKGDNILDIVTTVNGITTLEQDASLTGSGTLNILGGINFVGNNVFGVNATFDGDTTLDGDITFGKAGSTSVIKVNGTLTANDNVNFEGIGLDNADDSTTSSVNVQKTASFKNENSVNTALNLNGEDAVNTFTDATITGDGKVNIKNNASFVGTNTLSIDTDINGTNITFEKLTIDGANVNFFDSASDLSSNLEIGDGSLILQNGADANVYGNFVGGSAKSMLGILNSTLTVGGTFTLNATGLNLSEATIDIGTVATPQDLDMSQGNKISLSDNSTINVSGNVLAGANGSTLEIKNNSNFNVSGSFALGETALTVDNSTFSLDKISNVAQNLDLTAGGSIYLKNGATLNVSGNLVNDTPKFDSYKRKIEISDGSTLNVSGTSSIINTELTISNSILDINNNVDLTVVQQEAWSCGTSINLKDNATLSVYGNVTNSNASDNRSILNIEKGSTFNVLNSGNITLSGVVNLKGTLNVEGAINIEKSKANYDAPTTKINLYSGAVINSKDNQINVASGSIFKNNIQISLLGDFDSENESALRGKIVALPNTDGIADNPVYKPILTFNFKDSVGVASTGDISIGSLVVNKASILTLDLSGLDASNSKVLVEGISAYNDSYNNTAQLILNDFEKELLSIYVSNNNDMIFEGTNYDDIKLILQKGETTDKFIEVSLSEDGVMLTGDFNGIDVISNLNATVPEPSTYALIFGLFALGLAYNKKRK